MEGAGAVISMRPYLGTILITFVCILIFILLPDKSDAIVYTKLEKVSLLGTLLVVWWYTLETYLMQTAIKEQIDLSVMPSLALSKTGIDQFELINIGNGTACNIKFDDVPIGVLHKVKIHSVLCLPKNEKTEVKVESFINDNPTNFPVTAHLDEKYSKGQFNIYVDFEDILHRKYRQELSLGKEGPTIGKVVRND